MSIDTLKEVSARIRAAALAAADPGAAVRRAVSLRGDTLVAAGSSALLRGRLSLIAVGKAAMAMTCGALDRLGSRLDSGIVVHPHGYPTNALSDARLELCPSAHPVPDEHGLAAASAAWLSRLQLPTTLIAEHCVSFRAQRSGTPCCTDAEAQWFQTKFSLLSSQ